MMRGLKRRDPSSPKYDDTYDVTLVLDWIKKNLNKNSAMSLGNLRLKLILLFKIVQIKRSSDVANIEFSSLSMSGEKPFFKLQKEKANKDGIVSNTNKRYSLLPNSEDSDMCIVKCIQHYVERTKGLKRSDNTLIISLKASGESYKRVLPVTVAKLTLNVLGKAGVPENFKAHSLRMAAATKLLDAGFSEADVMTIGGWSSRNVFNKFYDRRKLKSGVAEAMSIKNTAAHPDEDSESSGED